MNIYFSGGRRGDHEAGMYQFWSIGDDTDRATFRATGDPVRRVHDMLNSGVYRDCWAACEKGGLRPATPEEVAVWLADHPHDARYAA